MQILATGVDDRLRFMQPALMKKNSISVEDRPREQRRNPQVLRRLIAHLINIYFDGEKKKTIEQLETHRRRLTSINDGQVIKRTKLNGILDDESWIEYRHLEGFAYKAGVPTFVLLAFSRALSEMDAIAAAKDTSSVSSVDDLAEVSARAEEAARTLEAMRAFFSEAGQLIKDHTSSIEDIETWIEIYKKDADFRLE